MVLERLVTAKHLLDAAAIDRRKVAWAEDYLRGRASAAGTMSGPWSGHSATGEMRRSRSFAGRGEPAVLADSAIRGRHGHRPDQQPVVAVSITV